MVEALLARKDVKVNAGDDAGHTPLYWANKHNHILIAELLSKQGGILK